MNTQLCTQLTKPKHVADDKLFIQLCLDLFFISFISSIFKHNGDALLQKKKKVCTYFSPKIRALQSFEIYGNDNTVSDCRRLKFSTFYMITFIAYYH
jgi:hypothetical protein